MNKLKTETKIGIIVLLTLALVIWGINFLKGKNILKRTDVFYVVYEDIQGIDVSAPVLINGYKAGMVNGIAFEKNKLDRIIISFTVEHKFKIPVHSLVELHSADLLGTKALRIIPSNEISYHDFGDTLLSSVKKDMTTALSDELLPLKGRIESAVIEIDTLIGSLNKILDEGTALTLKSTIAHLNTISSNLSRQTSSGGDLDQTIRSLKDFSSTLTNNQQKLDLIFTNIESLSDSIAKSNVKELIASLHSTFSESSNILHKMNAGEGSLGLLATNDSLYLNLNEAIESLDVLLKDLNEHPKRYVHFSLFGKKD